MTLIQSCASKHCLYEAGENVPRLKALMALRWAALSLLEAKAGFWRLKAYRFKFRVTRRIVPCMFSIAFA